MEDYSFQDELVCLKSCYDSTELNYTMLNSSHLLKFSLLSNTSITFEIPSTYPKNPLSLSVTTTELTNAERSEVERELRHFADTSTSYPMIMDLVIKFQQLISDHHNRKANVCEKHSAESKSIYTLVVLIDHMRQKKKYSNTLSSWATELQIAGFLLFYKRWIFLILQGSKKNVKDFVIRHKSVCIDVDSSGKQCKEKMLTVLYDGIGVENFAEFSVKEVASLEEMEVCFTQSQTMNIFQDIIKPTINKNRRDL